MKKATIVNLSGSWGSGIAQLTLRVGRKKVVVPCENGPTVRALDAIFGDVIAPGHSVNVDAIRGKKVRYCLDDMGLMLGGLAPVED